MARLSINEMTTYRWSFEEDVAYYVRAGISAIGVWRRKLSDYGEEKGVELLKESGLGVSNLLWAGGFTGSDGRTYEESVQDARNAIKLAAELDAGCLVVYTGARNGHTCRHAHRLVRDALRRLAPLASDLGVTMAIEPMHVESATEWTFLTDCESTLDLIAEQASGCVKLAFDTYHMGHDPRVLDHLSDLAGHIAVVHLGDSRRPPDREQERCWLGHGNVPLKKIVAALTSAGYTGDFDVELMGQEIETSDYANLISHAKRTFEGLNA